MDVDLPRLSGFDALVEIRAHYSAAELPIVMFTGSANEYLEELCQQLGANGYAVKPVSYQAYSACIRDIAARWMRRL